MALPHPLGTASIGDLFYPGAPAVTVADAAGAAGSRAVEFGEDGSSAAVNRGLYAAGKNTDYIFAAFQRDLAKPERVAWTPAAGNGGSYTFAGLKVWVGNVSYPDTQESLNRLFVVLDAFGRELIDPTTGWRVVVDLVENPAAPGVSIVGNEFFTGAKVFFDLQNPYTLALAGAPYVIPNGTDVSFSFAIAKTAENLCAFAGHPDGDTPEEIHDIGARLIFGGSRTPAEAFLADGSRTMVGNMNLGLYGLKDQYVTGAAVPLGDASAASVYSPQSRHENLVGGVTSNARIGEGLGGTRALSFGAFTYNDGSGLITWANPFHIVYEGVWIDVPANPIAGILATGINPEYLVYDTTTDTVIVRDANAVVATDVLLDYHLWDNGIPGGELFTANDDLRWKLSGKASDLEVSVGNAPGTDFLYVDDALQLFNHLVTILGAGGVTRKTRYRMRISGGALMQSVVTLLTPLTIEGDDGYLDYIKTATGASNVDLIDCGGMRVHVRNLRVLWADGAQGDGKGLFKNPGARSKFSNVSFAGDGGGDTISSVCTWTGASSDLKFRDCKVADITRSFLLGTGTTFASPTGHTSEVLVDSCRISAAAGGAQVGIDLPGGDSVVRNSTLSGDFAEATVRVGRRGSVKGCTLSNGGGNYVVALHSPYIGRHKACVSDCSITGTTGVEGVVYIDGGVAPIKDLDISVRDNFISSCDTSVSIVGDGTGLDYTTSHVSVADNTIDGVVAAGYGIIVKYTGSTKLTSNTVLSNAGWGIVVQDGVWGVVEGNRIPTKGTGTGCLSYSSERVGVIRGNFFGDDSSDVGGTLVSISSVVRFIDNTVRGKTAVTGCGVKFTATAAGSIVRGNHFAQLGVASSGPVYNAAICVDSGLVCQGTKIHDNEFTAIAGAGMGVRLVDVDDAQIKGNYFHDMEGKGVYIEEASGGSIGANVSNNTFTKVWGGSGGSNHHIIFVDGGGTAGSNVTIKGNTFRLCGNPTITGTDNLYIIYAAEKANVSGNTIYDVDHGPASGSPAQDGAVFMIAIGEQSLVYGNKLYYNFNGRTRSPLALYGIYTAATYVHIANNVFNWTGTAAGAEAYSYVVGAMLGSYNNFVSNRFSLFISNATHEYDVLQDSAPVTYHQMVMGNVFFQDAFEAGSNALDSTCMALGNVMEGGNTLELGAAQPASTTPYASRSGGNDTIVKDLNSGV